MAGYVQIVVRTKDRPLFLPRALQSIIEQTYPNWHCTVVNDGGDPAVVNEIMCGLYGLANGRLSVIHNETSLGMEAASNRGLYDCSADYYIIHDDDDSWAPDFLEKCIGRLESQLVGSVQGVVAHTVKVLENVDGDKIVRQKCSPYLPEVTCFTIPRVVQENPFMPIAFLYTKKALDTLGGYEEALPVVGDWEFNLRFIQHFDIAYEFGTTAYYHVRIGESGTSSDNSVAKAHLHSYYRSLIVNRYIRDAMDKGDVSIGSIMAAIEPGMYSDRLGEKLTYLYRRLKRWRPKIMSRYIKGGQ